MLPRFRSPVLSDHAHDLSTLKEAKAEYAKLQ
jgi:hypothetical protein